MTTPLPLADWKAKAEAASLNWRAVIGIRWAWPIPSDVKTDTVCDHIASGGAPDATLAMIAEIVRLRAENDDLRKERDEVVAYELGEDLK